MYVLSVCIMHVVVQWWLNVMMVVGCGRGLTIDYIAFNKLKQTINYEYRPVGWPYLHHDQCWQLSHLYINC